MDFSSINAARAYDAARTAAQSKTAPQDVQQPTGASFGDTIQEATSETMATIKRGEQTAIEGMSGQADATSVVEALAQAEMALQTAVTVRDKVVEAYQEILRMPV